MGKTKKWAPKNGEFKRLRGNKKQRTKRQRSKKANLQKEIKFTNRNPNTGFVNCWDAEPNDETLAAIEEQDLSDQ